MGKKEKLLVMSSFSFSHSVFKRLVSQGRQKVSLCGNGLKWHTYSVEIERWTEKIGLTRMFFLLTFSIARIKRKLLFYLEIRLFGPLVENGSKLARSKFLLFTFCLISIFLQETNAWTDQTIIDRHLQIIITYF